MAAGRPCASPGARITATADGRTIYLVGLPEFKLSDAVGFPIVAAVGSSRVASLSI